MPQIHPRGLLVNEQSRRWLGQSFDRLRTLISISAAAVVLERRRDAAPAFRAFVSLAVPGPDIHAEARDHTLEAAWLKVIGALRRQIQLRKARPDARMKTEAHLRTAPSRRTGVLAGSRG
jgi:ribosome-associated translation inhibitor RaiA